MWIECNGMPRPVDLKIRLHKLIMSGIGEFGRPASQRSIDTKVGFHMSISTEVKMGSETKLTLDLKSLPAESLPDLQRHLEQLAMQLELMIKNEVRFLEARDDVDARGYHALCLRTEVKFHQLTDELKDTWKYLNGEVSISELGFPEFESTS
jgi:hypothetical protein